MDAKDFVIKVGPNGTFRPSGSYQTLPEHLDSIFMKYKNANVKKITIYFHGGLVNENSGMEIAYKMANHFIEVGQTPLCFVWETGLLDSFAMNLRSIAGTELYTKIVKVLVKKLSEKLGFGILRGRGLGEPLTDAYIEQELNNVSPFSEYRFQNLGARGAEAIQSIPKDENSFKQSLEADFYFLISSDIKFEEEINRTPFSVNNNQSTQSRGVISIAFLVTHLANIAFNVIKRFINKRDHDFFPTIVEEILRELYIADIGAHVWNNMKIKSEDMWKDNNGFKGLNTHAGRYLLEKLFEFVNNNNVEVNLIGHSAGSIAICNMLHASCKTFPSLIFNNIIFMAPACRIDLFHREVVKYPSRFKKFRMFTMKNEYEVKDNLVAYFYTHSLLYFISGILENDGNDFDSYILGLDRHISNIPPYDNEAILKETNNYLFVDGLNRVIYSRSDKNAIDGLNSFSVSHGGFDDDIPGTIDSIKYILK